MDLSKAITFCRPGASWSLAGNDYAGLDWHDTAQTKPTLAELQEAWAALNTPPPIPPQPPTNVTMGALRIALGRDVCIAVGAWIQSLTDAEQKFQASTWWEFQPYVRRDHPVVEQFRVALSKTEQQVDQWFAAAKQLDQM